MENINLADFDVMGIFTLNEVTGIEEYVTKMSDGQYLSRSKKYYESKNFTELSIDRDFLSTQLTMENSRRNFVILENMLNASAKVYYASLKDHILHGETKAYSQAKVCFEEDVKNIVSILSNSKITKPSQKLPTGTIKTPERAIELDNKALLQIFCSTVDIPNDKHILMPGYGSLYLGEFLHCMKGNSYSNLLKSSYIQDDEEKRLLSTKTDIFDLVSNSFALKSSKSVILLDDNVGTGQTMQEIKKQLQEKGIHTSCGAVQYNWINYVHFFEGKKNITFNTKDFDYMTPFNYPGHKLMEHAIDRLRVSGDEYVKYLKSKSYRSDMINDFIGSIARSELYTQNLHFDLYKDKSYTPVAIKTNLAMKKKIFNLSSKTWFDRYKIKKGIKEFKKYFLTTIPPFEETDTLIGNKIEKTRVENLNKLAELRKRLAKKIDKTLGTNISEVKLPPIMKKTERKINNLLEKIKNKKANGK
ncbi:MAG: hypothetical protein J5896_02960 [Alphaproteobacteria bacterium]|nr:hypothetical protein [Alphaproteobacteria bacterium]